VLEGAGIITRGEEPISVKKDDIIYVPAKVMHDIQNTGQERLVVFFVKNKSPK